MIILRQKEYSNRFTKFAYSITKPITEGLSKVSNSNVGSKVRKFISPEMEQAFQSAKIHEVPKIKAARRALILNKSLNTPNGRKRLLRKARNSAIGAAVNAERFGEQFALDPGKYVSKGARFVTTRPLDASWRAGALYANVNYPITNAFPIGSAGTVVEQVARKVSPKYAKVITGMENVYDKYAGPVISAGTNAVVNTFKNL